jgi:hypothetical protein
MNAKIEQTINQHLGDAEVLSISWTKEDLYVSFNIRGRGNTSSVLNLCFKWITHLKIDLDYGGYVGPPLLFSAEAKKGENAIVRVIMEFGAAPNGLIRFDCNDITEGTDPNKAG